MISKFGKELIASGIPEDVVKRAYDFVEKQISVRVLLAKMLNYVGLSKTLLQLHISLVLENKKKEYLKS